MKNQRNNEKNNEDNNNKYPWEFTVMLGSLVLGALFMLLKLFELI